MFFLLNTCRQDPGNQLVRQPHLHRESRPTHPPFLLSLTNPCCTCPSNCCPQAHLVSPLGPAPPYKREEPRRASPSLSPAGAGCSHR